MNHSPEDDLGQLLGHCGSYYAHRIGGHRRGQRNVLAWLDSRPNATQKELAEAMNVMPASLSELLQKLERKGFITRSKDPEDHRFTRVRLTEAGRAALNRERQVQTEDPFSALTDEEQRELGRLLVKLLGDWENRYPHERPRPPGGHPCHGQRER
ncbi:MAG: MarR family transcriptional regulator [Oscillospiraceae bacterium]|nr:MarR family transcriptional regulator [Oscillospiraceae bacterium]